MSMKTLVGKALPRPELFLEILLLWRFCAEIPQTDCSKSAEETESLLRTKREFARTWT
jgi:hypothetical protein